MKNLYDLLNNLISVGLIVVAGVTPLLFLNIFTDSYDIPKLIFLVVMTMVLLALWLLSWIAKGKVVVTRTPLDTPLLMLLITVIASTVFSASRFISIYGAFPEVHGSAVSWITYILLYFIAVSNLRKLWQIKAVVYALLASASLLALISILSFFNVYLPFDPARSPNFTPTGLTFSTVAILLMLMPLTLIATVKQNNFLPGAAAVTLSILFGASVVFTGKLPANVILVLLFGAVLTLVRRHLSTTNFILLLTPMITSVILMVFLNMPFPGNILHDKKNIFPQEIQLPLDISWKVSASSFRDAPFLGTGPSTYLFNFTNYKPIEFNQLRIWNFSFGSAHNELLQTLATLGLFGLLSLIALSTAVTAASKKLLFSKRSAAASSKDDSHLMLPSLALGGTIAVILLLVHSLTLVSAFISLIFFALLMVSQKGVRENTSELSLGINVLSSDNKRYDLLPPLLFVVFLIAGAPVSVKAYNAARADYYHKLALSQADKDGTKTYEYLQQAETLNPHIDLYRVDMAQTNFALANTLAAQKGPSQEDPEGSLTDADRQTIQTLVTQAINEGRASVILSPRSSRNWEVLGQLYRNITGVADNAMTFSLDAYGRAIQMDPFNPELRVNVGSLYHSMQNYDMAIRFYTDSVNLKPDYVNGYYNLAVALRDKGDLQSAQQIADQAVKLLQQDVSEQEGPAPQNLKELRIRDLNAATKLLSEIKNMIRNEAEATDESALQNPQLPDIEVPDLETPPDTTVPPQIDENPEAILPDDASEPTPTPTGAL